MGEPPGLGDAGRVGRGRSARSGSATGPVGRSVQEPTVGPAVGHRGRAVGAAGVVPARTASPVRPPGRSSRTPPVVRAPGRWCRRGGPRDGSGGGPGGAPRRGRTGRWRRRAAAGRCGSVAVVPYAGNDRAGSRSVTGISGMWFRHSRSGPMPHNAPRCVRCRTSVFAAGRLGGCGGWSGSSFSRCRDPGKCAENEFFTWFVLGVGWIVPANSAAARPGGPRPGRRGKGGVRLTSPFGETAGQGGLQSGGGRGRSDVVGRRGNRGGGRVFGRRSVSMGAAVGRATVRGPGPFPPPESPSGWFPVSFRPPRCARDGDVSLPTGKKIPGRRRPYRDTDPTAVRERETTRSRRLGERHLARAPRPAVRGSPPLPGRARAAPAGRRETAESRPDPPRPTRDRSAVPWEARRGPAAGPRGARGGRGNEKSRAPTGSGPGFAARRIGDLNPGRA